MKPLQGMLVALALLGPALAWADSDATPDFQPPARDSVPDSDYGKVIRFGQQVFDHTGEYAAAYVGNHLRCANCHLGSGRQPNSAPLWGAYVLYPAYRTKNRHVNTYAERLQECFRYSMNGKAPPLGDPVLVALETYSYWLAQGAPTGVKLKGQGYAKLGKPAQEPDYARGQKVYETRCALCHGADGAGQRNGGEQVFPALWGLDSFNWGAGMHSVNNAAAFIKANMPLGQGGSLADQDAWDVAQFVDSHERPQDPRYTGDVAETRAKFHDTSDSMYGLSVNGHVLGSDSVAPGGPPP